MYQRTFVFNSFELTDNSTVIVVTAALSNNNWTSDISFIYLLKFSKIVTEQPVLNDILKITNKISKKISVVQENVYIDARKDINESDFTDISVEIAFNKTEP